MNSKSTWICPLCGQSNWRQGLCSDCEHELDTSYQHVDDYENGWQDGYNEAETEAYQLGYDKGYAEAAWKYAFPPSKWLYGSILWLREKILGKTQSTDTDDIPF